MSAGLDPGTSLLDHSGPQFVHLGSGSCAGGLGRQAGWGLNPSGALKEGAQEPRSASKIENPGHLGVRINHKELVTVW